MQLTASVISSSSHINFFLPPLIANWFPHVFRLFIVVQRRRSPSTRQWSAENMPSWLRFVWICVPRELLVPYWIDKFNQLLLSQEQKRLERSEEGQTESRCFLFVGAWKRFPSLLTHDESIGSHLGVRTRRKEPSKAPVSICFSQRSPHWKHFQAFPRFP